MVRSAQSPALVQDSVASTSFKTTELGLLPADWDVGPVKQFSRPVRGGSPRPAGDPRYFNGTFLPWLTVAGLTNIPMSIFLVTETETHLTEEGSCHSRTLEAGTVIIANSGATLGVAKILGMRCCANDGVAALLDLRKTVSPLYIVYYFNSKIRYLREVVARGNGQPNLNTTLIGEFLVPLPPLKEQECVARALADIDEYIDTLERLVIKKRAIKKGAMQELLTGKRRLPGFSEEWRQVRLGRLGEFSKGGGVKRDDAQSGTLPCVRYGELYTAHHDIVREYHSWISPSVAAFARAVKGGDILFAGSGETKEEIGKCAAIPGQGEAYAGGDVIVFRPASDDSTFLGYYLNAPLVQRQKARKGQGDAVVHISASALADVELSLPGKPEQVAIATVLTDIDDEIESSAKKLGKARLIKQGMMQDLLTGRTRLV